MGRGGPLHPPGRPLKIDYYALALIVNKL
jgi:hypothetical protein